MTPRIYFSQGQWWCSYKRAGREHLCMGRGNSPEAAYWSWAWLEERLGRNRHHR